MRCSARGSSGVWETFVPTSARARSTSSRSTTRTATCMLKADPYGFQMQLRPDNASIVADIGGYHWNDDEWLAQRGAWDPLRAPISIYEVHPGSWRRSWHRKPAFLTWDELADQLIPVRARPGLHARRAGRRRRASVRRLVGLSGARSLRADCAARHAARLQALRRSPAPGRHRRVHGLGAGAFSEGRARPRGVRRHALCTSTPIRAAASTSSGARRSSTTAATRCATSWSRTRCSGSSSITSTACAWMRSPRCCISTTRRKHGEWTPNRYGGRENLEAIEFLKQLNWTIGHYFPGVLTMAEESTSFPGVTPPGAPGRARLSLQVEHGLDERHAALHVARSAAPAPSSQPDHVLVRVRVLGALHPAAVARRGRARQALAARQDAGRRVAEAGELSPADRLHDRRTRARS